MVGELLCPVCRLVVYVPLEVTPPVNTFNLETVKIVVYEKTFFNGQIDENKPCIYDLGGGESLGQPYGNHGGIYGRQQQQSNTLGRPTNMQQQQFLTRQNTPPGSIGSRQSNTPPTASGIPNQIAPNQQGMMTRPSQRPPSPPLPPPPMGGSTGMPPHSQGQNYDAQQQATYMQHMYSRQASELSSNPNFTADKAGKCHYNYYP